VSVKTGHRWFSEMKMGASDVSREGRTRAPCRWRASWRGRKFKGVDPSKEKGKIAMGQEEFIGGEDAEGKGRDGGPYGGRELGNAKKAEKITKRFG